MAGWQDRRVIYAAAVVIALIASIDKYRRPPQLFGGVRTTHYNNYNIYTAASRHLASGDDLYRYYPAEQQDLYLYSPTFAALFYPLSRMPDLVGL